jgi:hypothetical protein
VVLIGGTHLASVGDAEGVELIVAGFALWHLGTLG